MSEFREPWKFDKGAHYVLSGVDIVASTACTRAGGVYGERIVAAVNATAGISTKALESGAVAELVAALDLVANHPQSPTVCKSAARAALARVRGE